MFHWIQDQVYSKMMSSICWCVMVISMPLKVQKSTYTKLWSGNNNKILKAKDFCSVHELKTLNYTLTAQTSCKRWRLIAMFTQLNLIKSNRQKWAFCASLAGEHWSKCRKYYFCLGINWHWGHHKKFHERVFFKKNLCYEGNNEIM